MDEARRSLKLLLERELYSETQSTAKALMDVLQFRIGEIESAYDAIRLADPLLQPVIFLSHIETEIAFRVFDDFQPALPLDPVSLLYSTTGLVLGLGIYEILKLPFAVAFRGNKSEVD